MTLIILFILFGLLIKLFFLYEFSEEKTKIKIISKIPIIFNIIKKKTIILLTRYLYVDRKNFILV